MPRARSSDWFPDWSPHGQQSWSRHLPLYLTHQHWAGRGFSDAAELLETPCWWKAETDKNIVEKQLFINVDDVLRLLSVELFT